MTLSIGTCRCLSKAGSAAAEAVVFVLFGALRHESRPQCRSRASYRAMLRRSHLKLNRLCMVRFGDRRSLQAALDLNVCRNVDRRRFEGHLVLPRNNAGQLSACALHQRIAARGKSAHAEAVTLVHHPERSWRDIRRAIRPRFELRERPTKVWPGQIPTQTSADGMET